ncbi:4Fe-4S ferredoxin iron-sulfur binding domain protein [mine drainage metagenome]|uniref:4Fe-4S ferredoxin iron-sulfur binding domain protein n=1 Tax=mine drainage metagenome TaxID=410659 RepID=T0Y3P1_9ZZZZ
MCLLTCGNDVFRWKRSEHRPLVTNPGKCVVGCTTCARVCAQDALTFPSDPKVFVRGVVTKFKVLPAVKRDLEARLRKFPDHVVRATGDGAGSEKEN